MLIVYLCGALVTALATMGGAIRFSDPHTGPRTQLAVAVMAGVFWPVVVIGALQAMGMLLLANWMRTAPAAESAPAAEAAPAPAPAAEAAPAADMEARSSELVFTG